MMASITAAASGARPRRSTAPGGGGTARGGGLTAGLCVKHAAPGYRGTQMCTQDYSSTAVSLLFFSQSLIRIVSRQHPQWTRLLLHAPPGCNNNNARDRVIYVRVITDPGGGTTHACSSSSSKLMVWVSVVRHHHQDVTRTADAAVGLMQVVLTSECLSPSPSRTLKSVFVPEFFFFCFSSFGGTQ
jgi:hypothetical protein